MFSHRMNREGPQSHHGWPDHNLAKLMGERERSPCCLPSFFISSTFRQGDIDDKVKFVRQGDSMETERQVSVKCYHPLHQTRDQGHSIHVHHILSLSLVHIRPRGQGPTRNTRIHRHRSCLGDKTCLKDSNSLTQKKVLLPR